MSESNPAAGTRVGEDLLAELTDDFLRRHRAGETPSLDEYAKRHPELADQIRDLFPAMIAMEHPGFAAVLDPAPPAERIGATIGRYKLLERIGEGGFGVVYMAEQQHPVRRKVALKVIKPGFDTTQVIARFEAERQALALMDHENIARVFDAGATDTGRPYFVMELVHGVPITDFCDKNQLPPRERLELFVQVCRAVQHAHTKGIIHRDIKPTNVLVTLHEGNAVPKIIDFGVVKATGQQLTEKTLFTNFAQMVGTPLYMSPEQAEMTSLDVDTRSDVYSLGVLLYELLTGTTPLDKDRLKRAAFDEVRRIIREEEPPRPSTRLSTMGEQGRTIAAQRKSDPHHLGRLMRGELDWIVMKALEKERARRYETATGLARDIERYLKDETVEACPPSAWYRFRKFTRRNKSGLAVATLVLLFLASLGGVAGWVTSQHAAQRKALEADIGRDLDEVRDLCRQDRLREAGTVLSHAEALAARGGADEDLGRRVAQLRKDLDMAARLEAIRMGNAAVKDEKFDRDGTVLHYAEAFRDYGLDLDKLEPDLAAAHIEISAIRLQLVAALDDWLTGSSGRNQERLLAVLVRADADPWRRRLRAAHADKNLQALRELAQEATAPAQPPATARLLSRALSSLDDNKLAVEFLHRAQQQYPSDFWLNEQLGLSLLMDLEPPRPAEAVGYFRAAVALRPESPGAVYNLGFALQQQKDWPGAIAAFRNAIALKPDYVSAHNGLAVGLLNQGDHAGAVAASRNAIALKSDLHQAHLNLGVAWHEQRDYPNAIAAYRKAIAVKPNYALAHFELGRALQAQGQIEALEELRRAYELAAWDSQWRERSPQWLLQLTRSYIYWRQRDLTAAEKVMADLWARPSPELLDRLNLEAYFLRRDGDLEQARELRSRVVDAAKKHFSPGGARLVKYQNDYIQLLKCDAALRRGCSRSERRSQIVAFPGDNVAPDDVTVTRQRL